MSVEPQKPQVHPSPPFIATAPALEALALLDRGLGSREPVVLVTGEPGGGKSTLVREAVQRWGARVCARYLSPADATAETLFAVLLSRFGGTSNSQASGPALTQRLMEAIAHGATGGKVVLVIVDDAHLAASELLLQLVNVAEMARAKNCPFEVLLVGTPQLSARLGDPALAGLADKVGSQVRLSALTQHDTRHYLLQRAGHEGANASGLFSRKACRDIHGATFGIPRAIEALADESARRAAKAGGTTISPEHVRAAAQALRARRGQAPTTVIAPRAERMGTAAPKPAPERASGTITPPAGTNGGPTPSSVSPKPEGANAGPTPGAVSPKPAGTNGVPRVEPARRADAAPPAKAPPAPAVPASASAASVAPRAESTPATSGEIKFPEANDQRVKDWVSRFGGGSPVRIGVGHAVPRYEASATLDVPPPARPATPSRILIVDEEPQLPPELVARITKLSKKKRRRGPSSTVQGAALALAVLMLMVVLARQAGFGKRIGLEAADSSGRPVVAVTAPPLALGLGAEPGVMPHVATPSAPHVSAHGGARNQKPAAKPKPKPAPRHAVASTPTHAEAPPPIPYRTPSTAPVQTLPAPAETRVDDSPGVTGHKFGIIAGAFPSGDMAKAEKDHLARLVPYRVWVDKSKVQGVRTYELMVGRFDTMEHAWDSAQVLMRRGLIRDANVRLLSEREAR